MGEPRPCLPGIANAEVGPERLGAVPVSKTGCRDLPARGFESLPLRLASDPLRRRDDPLYRYLEWEGQRGPAWVRTEAGAPARRPLRIIRLDSSHGGPVRLGHEERTGLQSRHLGSAQANTGQCRRRVVPTSCSARRARHSPHRSLLCCDPIVRRCSDGSTEADINLNKSVRTAAAATSAFGTAAWACSGADNLARNGMDANQCTARGEDRLPA